MNLKRTLFGGVALMLLAQVAKVEAQIWTEYDINIEQQIFQPLAGGTTIPRSDFVDLFSNFVNPDDGVTRTPIPLGFDFEYDGQVFNSIYVSINGFASFEGRFIVNDPFTLFTPTNGPNLTLAPYFGDHYLRTAGIDLLDPSGRPFTPTVIKWRHNSAASDPKGLGRRSFQVEWQNVNINYFFDPLDPGNPFSPGREAQAPSIATFQLWIYEANPAFAPSRRGSIEFHYGDAGTGSGVSIVKFSGASVGIEDEPAVPNGNTTFINAVTYAETGNKILARSDTRLSSNWPPVGLPGRIFVFTGDSSLGAPGWGDGDANLTQVQAGVPDYIRGDQRLFVTMADVIRILRHQATRNVDFDSAVNRHGFHGDVNHNGRFYYSTSNYNNTGDSLDQFNDVVRYKVMWPVKSTNHLLPFPNDNTFNGFFFDADEFDASLIMLYLAAKLPVMPWLPDTLPHFTGKTLPVSIASDVKFGTQGTITGRRVEIPVTVNGMVNGSVGVRMQLASGARILDVITPEQTDNQYSLAVAGDQKVAIAAAGHYGAGDVIATLVVEAAENGDVIFDDVVFNETEKGARKLNIYGATAGEAGGLMLSANYPNPFTINTTTTFDYAVPQSGQVRVRIFDVMGKEIATLVNTELAAGSYTGQWNGLTAAGQPVSAGVYYCRIEANGQTAVMTMQVTK